MFIKVQLNPVGVTKGLHADTSAAVPDGGQPGQSGETWLEGSEAQLEVGDDVVDGLEADR